jgi:hypothetical protein
MLRSTLVLLGGLSLSACATLLGLNDELPGGASSSSGHGTSSGSAGQGTSSGGGQPPMDSGPSDAETMDAVAPDASALTFCQKQTSSLFCDDFESGSLSTAWQMAAGKVPSVVLLATNRVVKSDLPNNLAPPSELYFKAQFTSVEFDLMYQASGGLTKRVAQVIAGPNCYANLLVQSGTLSLLSANGRHSFSVEPGQWVRVLLTFDAMQIVVKVGSEMGTASTTGCTSMREFRVGFASGDNQVATAYFDNVLAL